MNIFPLADEFAASLSRLYENQQIRNYLVRTIQTFGETWKTEGKQNAPPNIENSEPITFVIVIDIDVERN